MERINVTRTSMPDYEEYIREIAPIWESHWLSNMGVKHQELEKSLCEYLDIPYMSLFTNGHLALESAIAAMEIEGEVITTPFTFSSTTQAIVQNGLVPVFCDINEDDYTIDVTKIEALITEKTSAIIPVHVYGSVCDVFAIEEIAKKYNLKVIYDAAHVFGVKIGDKSIASFGDASMFSFHATKVFNTIEGGGVAYKDSALTERLYAEKNFGMTPEGEYYVVSGNKKMTEFQAAMGICNLRHIDRELEKRKQVAHKYMERLSGVAGVKIWKEQKDVKHNYAYFPVLFDKSIFGKTRDEVAALLEKENIFPRKYFYPLTSRFECYKGKFPIQVTPIAERISENILALPMFADLPLEDVDKICNIILG